MLDNRYTRGPQDANRININENYELAYWTQKFGVSSRKLRAVVREVGVIAQAVEVRLSNEMRSLNSIKSMGRSRSTAMAM